MHHHFVMLFWHGEEIEVAGCSNVFGSVQSLMHWNTEVLGDYHCMLWSISKAMQGNVAAGLDDSILVTYVVVLYGSFLAGVREIAVVVSSLTHDQHTMFSCTE